MTDATGKVQVPGSTVAADSRTAGPSKGRRRLILAAGAVLPSVYTLSSGAGTAAASNTVCRAKGGTPPARFTSEGDYVRMPDGWVRAPVDVGEFQGSPADCVSTPQSACADFSSATIARTGPNLSSTTEGTVSSQEGSVWIVRGQRMVSSSHVRIENISPLQKQYGLVYVDQTGTVSTLDPDGGGGGLKPVTASCWASMTGGSKSKLG